MIDLRESGPLSADAPPARRFGFLATILTFGAAAALLGLMTGPVHRWFIDATGVEPVVAWFVLGGAGVFAPLLLFSATALLLEGRFDRRAWRDRLRFRPLDRGDWIWTGYGAIAIVVATGSIVAISATLGIELDLHPSFLRLEPLGADRLWILALWFPFWLLNIFGEEIAWRGVVLPGQEAAFGRYTWLVNGTAWLLFHVPFGWQLLLILTPTVFVIPYVVQRRKNSWIGVLLHAGLNGPGFLAVAFGLV